MFNRVADQYELRTINRGMYLGRMDELTLQVYAVCKAVRPDSPHTWDVTGLDELARECQRYYNKCMKPGDEEYDEYLATMII